MGSYSTALRSIMAKTSIKVSVVLAPNEKLNDLYCSPNIGRVIKSRMRWAGQVARMDKRRGI